MAGKEIVIGTYVGFGPTPTYYQDFINSASLEMTMAEQTTTNMNSGGAEEYIPGLESASFSVKFMMDGDFSTIDATFYAYWKNRTQVAVKLRKTSAAIATDNPEYRFNIFVTKWTPITGSVGDVRQSDYQWKVSGPVTRFTS